MTPSQSKSSAKRASTVFDAAARTARRAEREDDRGAPRAETRGAAAGRTEASAEAGMASASVGVKAPVHPRAASGVGRSSRASTRERADERERQVIHFPIFRTECPRNSATRGRLPLVDSRFSILRFRFGVF